MRNIALVLSVVVLSQLTACVVPRHYSDSPTRSYNGYNTQYPAQYPNQYPNQYPSQPVYRQAPQVQVPQDQYRSDYQSYDQQSQANWAQVIDVRQTRQVSRGSGGGGALVGAIVGGIIGNQLARNDGHGSDRRYGNGYGRGYDRYRDNNDGRDAATVGGAIVGGVIGNEMDRSSGEVRIRTEVTLRFTNGQTQTLPLDNSANFRVGDWIQVGYQGGRWVIF